MQIVLFTVNIVAPIFILILLGIFLKQIGMVNSEFVSKSSLLVFKVSLPSLIFLKIATVKISEAFDAKLILTSLLIVFLIASFSWFLSTILTKNPKDKGVFIQGSFRSNFAIIGLALVSNLLGESELGRASLVLAFVMPLYNILAIIALTLPISKSAENAVLKSIGEIVKNPLIIAAVAAAPFSIYSIHLGSIATTTLTYLAKISLPLALISIGASLNLTNLKEASKLSLAAMFNKLILFPTVAVVIGIFLHFDSNQLGILFVLFASPTAIASFVMADAMGRNSKLASDIIVVTTLFSVITLSIGIIILKYFALI